MISSIFEAMPMSIDTCNDMAASARFAPRALRIAIATDAWQPQVNGVVRTLEHVVEEIKAMGHHVRIIEPGQFNTCRMPRYREIRLAMMPGRGVARKLRAYAPDAVHIATEGPIGVAARRFCGRMGWPFITSYHTQFPFYLQRYAHIPPRLTYRFIRWFHGEADRVLVPTNRVKQELEANGLDNAAVWTRGVDTRVFHPGAGTDRYADLPRPVFLYAGRVAVEKNIEAFLDLDLPGSKVVVGDGPAKPRLMRKYSHAHWVGYRFGEDLARHYADADVLVFPSRSDTFGIVMLEANACGLPIAAYPVTGPIDVVKHGQTGILDEDLQAACLAALKLDRQTCRQYAEQHSWKRCAQMVVDNVTTIDHHVDDDD